MKKLIEKKGITLVALVVTLIILIILAGISINLILGENGVLERALAAKEQATLAEQEEKDRLNQLYSSIMVATGDGAEITISMQDLNTLIDSKVDDKLSKIKTETVPAGTVISYMGNNAPEGYLFCNGATYNISDYSDLAEQIKNEFGSYNYYGGDGTTTFAVPNLQGEFLRGYSTSSTASKTSGVSTASVGQHQDGTRHTNIVGTSSTWVPASHGTKIDVQYSDLYLNHSNGNNRTITSNSETGGASAALYYLSRPTNTSVLYCIKY